MKISKKKGVQAYYIMLALAAITAIVSLCIYAIEFRQEMDYYTRSMESVWETFVYSFSDLFLLLFLIVIVAIYRRNSVAVPIVFITYLLYLAWITSEWMFEKYWDEHIDMILFFSVVCAIIACVIWMINPVSFKYFSFLYVPLSVAMIYYPIAKEQEWDDFLFFAAESFLFLALVLKSIAPEESDKLLTSRIYGYWSAGVLIVILHTIVYMSLVYYW